MELFDLNDQQQLVGISIELNEFLNESCFSSFFFSEIILSSPVFHILVTPSELTELNRFFNN